MESSSKASIFVPFTGYLMAKKLSNFRGIIPLIMDSAAGP